MNWTTLKLLEWTADYFTKHGIPSPRLDAELLLSHVLKKKRIELYLDFEKAVLEKDLAAFKTMIQRRAKREPLQYIVGTVDFCGVTLKVTPDVLIPRPETELLVEQALKLSTVHCPLSTVLDLCTGSACIIAALADKFPEARFTGTDISHAALDVARQNVEKWKERIELLRGDLFEVLPTREFDIITANPPYIPAGELGTLQPEVRDFEPKEALIAGQDGLAIIERIINDAHRHLRPGGHLVMEIGDKQADRVRGLIADNGHYGNTEMIKDYGGIERIAVSRKL